MFNWKSGRNIRQSCSLITEMQFVSMWLMVYILQFPLCTRISFYYLHVVQVKILNLAFQNSCFYNICSVMNRQSKCIHFILTGRLLSYIVIYWKSSVAIKTWIVWILWFFAMFYTPSLICVGKHQHSFFLICILICISVLYFIVLL